MLQDFFSGILIAIYTYVGDLGVSIIVLTILIRTLLLPITIPTLKARKKLSKLQPKLKKLKNKHKDKKKLQQAQLELYQKYNVNPLAGCLPQIVQLIVLLGLYRALNAFLGQEAVQGVEINPQFLWLNLAKPDQYYILPILAGLVQLVLALMISPGAEVRDIVPNEAKSEKVKQKNKEEEDTAEMAQTMQQQMIFIMPVMTAVIALKFPSGLALYWVVTNLFSITQQYFVSGWGGLKTYWRRLELKLSGLS
ncbi:MAG: membrane protein insertase YidC [Candidatus Pacebacteria bacterium]|nr:membrane protein insertase YidC [Candidatus Paceibacterota bacterium]